MRTTRATYTFTSEQCIADKLHHSDQDLVRYITILGNLYKHNAIDTQKSQRETWQSYHCTPEIQLLKSEKGKTLTPPVLPWHQNRRTHHECMDMKGFLTLHSAQTMPAESGPPCCGRDTIKSVHGAASSRMHATQAWIHRQHVNNLSTEVLQLLDHCLHRGRQNLHALGQSHSGNLYTHINHTTELITTHRDHMTTGLDDIQKYEMLHIYRIQLLY